MRLPVQLLSHDSFRVVMDGHDIWFNPQDYKRSYGLPRGKVKATWCFLTNLETAYVPILLDWAKGFKDVHFITGPMAHHELSEAGVPAEKLILADDHGWAISRQISFKAIGTVRDAPSYLLTTSIGNLSHRKWIWIKNHTCSTYKSWRSNFIVACLLFVCFFFFILFSWFIIMIFCNIFKTNNFTCLRIHYCLPTTINIFSISQNSINQSCFI